VRDAPAPMRDDFAASVRRDTFSLLIDAAEGRLTVRRLPDESAGAQQLRVLEIRGPGLEPVRWYITPNGLIARQRYTAVGADGQPAVTDETYSDYRMVNGIRMPFETQLVRAGSPVITRTLTTVTFNQRIEPSLFARPQ